MTSRFVPLAVDPASVPTVPAWATPRAPLESQTDAAYMAGSALNSLDKLVFSDAPWLGAWRHRLALRAAASTVKLLGRSESELELRDAWLLRAPGDEPGPAGSVLSAWRRLVGRSSTPEIEALATVAQLLGTKTSAKRDGLVDLLAEISAASAPAPIVAAEVGNAVIRREPVAEALAWWMADLALSLRMRWPLPIPILASQMHSPLLRLGSGRVRARPGGEGFERGCLIAAAAGAAEACKLASAMAVRAQRLQAVAPRLRSKGAGEVIELLLNEDAVSGSLTTKTLSRWASRRLFERLLALEAVRELSGRDSFRLFGL
ncbi:DUF1403 family protein [Pelagibacterium sp. H642]|uniref:DUF1403 family protein n=1 Tax=Pelagibacterium sp. H642 TaxID=1881069 RepID=UPI002814C582|nr:DUF1403 family protein [Pelagibacterium sp. H642]WMT92528.1 DUF1403 family protein [Pelagibacterium sp. H642]